MKIRYWLAVLFFALPGLVLAAGNLSYGPVGGKAQQMMEIGDGVMRMSMQGQSQWMLYRDDQQTVYMVDDAQRSYTKLDKQAAQQLNQQVTQMQKQIEAQLSALPPEQRAMMKSMMPAMPQLMEKHNYSVKKTGEEKQIQSWACQVYTVYDNGEPTDEFCVAPVKKLGVSQSDFELMKRMSTVLGSLAAQFGAGSMAAVIDKLEGMPVAFGSAGKQPKSVLLRVGKETPDAARMMLPPDYKEQSLMSPAMMP